MNYGTSMLTHQQHKESGFVFAYVFQFDRQFSSGILGREHTREEARVGEWPI